MPSRIIRITITQTDVVDSGLPGGERVVMDSTIKSAAEALPDDDLEQWRCMVALCDCANHADHLI